LHLLGGTVERNAPKLVKNLKQPAHHPSLSD
jgi:hypothetical protein